MVTNPAFGLLDLDISESSVEHVTSQALPVQSFRDDDDVKTAKLFTEKIVDLHLKKNCCLKKNVFKEKIVVLLCLHINRSGLNHTQEYTQLPIRYVICWTGIVNMTASERRRQNDGVRSMILGTTLYQTATSTVDINKVFCVHNRAIRPCPVILGTLCH